MSNTVLGLFGVGLAAALAELLLPGEEGRGTKWALRLMVSLAVLLLLLRPFLAFVGTSPEFAFENLVGEDAVDTKAHYTEIFEDAVAARSEKDLKSGLYTLLLAEYGIEKEDAHINIHFNDTGEVSLVEIYLSGKALLCDPDAIAADVGTRLGCETEVR